ncbi:MAG: glycosyltransferase [Marinosulfonomonas sp.]|nr:glycosyltransferase [Marinosulfonomonas sp.]
MPVSFQNQPDILHLTSAHPLQDTRIFVKEARSLSLAGFRVTVVGPGLDGAQPKTVDGVEIIPLPRPKGRVGRFLTLGLALYKTARRSNAKAIHIHDPDLMLLGLVLFWQGRCVIYDVHEDYRKSMGSRVWLRLDVLRKLAAFGVRWVEKRVASRFCGFVVADPALAATFPPSRCVVVRNHLLIREWPDSPGLIEESAAVRCIYVGDISEARGFSVMCDTISRAREQGVAATLDLVGEIPADLRKVLQTHPAKDHITAFGHCGRGEVVNRLSQSDIAFCLLAPTPAYLEALPVKILEYLMAGLPVIASDFPRLRTEKSLAPGLSFCDPENPAAVVAALKEIIKDRSCARSGALKARDAVIENYSWASEEAVLIEFYQNLLG